MPSFTEDRAPFERQPGESPKAWAAFVRYRDLGPAVRSLDRAWREAHAPQPAHKRRSKTWALWSARWGWPERAAAYDEHLERQKRHALHEEQVEAAKRHARAIQASISVTMLPVRITLETAATPAGMDTMRAAARANATGLRAAVAEARLSASHLPALVQAERLTLGMSTDYLEVSEKPLFDAVAARIVSDPVAVGIATELLNQLARPTPDDEEPS